MDVASLSAVPVGVVWWQSPAPALTVIVKATFSMAADGEAQLASVQEPLGLDEPYPPPDSRDIRHSADFAPLKAHADVLLVGRLYGAAPALALPAGFAIEQLERRFCAVSPSPSASLPLVPRCLRSSPAPDAPTVLVGPRATPHGSWWGHGTDAPFDFGQFNVAPAEQQLGLLRAGSVLRLDGLLAGVPRRTLQLPGLRPVVFYLRSPDARDLGVPLEVSLRCDTLGIDTERLCFTLSWRGVLALPPWHGASAFLVVALQGAAQPPRWDSIAPQLGMARWVRAAEPHDPWVPPSWVRSRPSALGLPSASVLPTVEVAPELSAPIPAATSPAEPPPPTLDRSLPFSRPAAATMPTSALPAYTRGSSNERASEGSTGVMDMVALRQRAALPFQAGAAPSSDPGAAAADLPTPADRGSATGAPEGRPASEPPPTDRRPAPSMRLGQAQLGQAGARLGAGLGLGLGLGAADPTTVDDEEDLATGQTAYVVDPAPPLSPVGGPPDAPPSASDRPFDGELQTVDWRTSRAGTALDPPPASVATALEPVRHDTAPPAPMPAAPVRHDTAPPAPMPAAPVPSPGRQRQQTLMVSGELGRSADALPFTEAIVGQSMQLASLATGAWKGSAAAGGTVVARDRGGEGSPLPAGWGKASPAGIDLPPMPVPAFSGTPALVPMPPLPPLASAPPVAPAAAPPAGQRVGPGQRPVVPLELYATVKAALWQSGASLPDVLGQHHIDEAVWHANERRQEEALAQEALAGKSDLANGLRAALLIARAKHVQAELPGLTLDEYVALRAAVDASEDPASVLRDKGLSEEQWHRARRDWHQRSLSDPELAKQLRAKLADARRAHRAGPPR